MLNHSMKLFAVHFSAPLDFLLSFFILAVQEASEEEQMLLYNSSDWVAHAALGVQPISWLKKKQKKQREQPVCFLKTYESI